MNLLLHSHTKLGQGSLLARVVVHNQKDPPSVLENSLSVPVGQSAYISIRARQIDDRSETGFSNCYMNNNEVTFELLQNNEYSLASCLSDCILKDIADVCKCIHGVPIPTTGRYANSQRCSLVQLCCIAASLITTEDCGCTISCNQSLFDATISYSTYPALAEFANLALLYNTTQEVIRDSFLSIRVFFSELITVREVTERSYSLTALIADIGGQLGLFLGASIISMTKFLTWLLDEFKDRCLGINEAKMREAIKKMITKASTADKTEMTDNELYNNHSENVTVNNNNNSFPEDMNELGESNSVHT